MLMSQVDTFYIYTIHQHTNYDTQGKHFNSLFISWAISAIQHITVAMVFKEHWPHDLHDSEEILFIFLQYIII